MKIYLDSLTNRRMNLLNRNRRKLMNLKNGRMKKKRKLELKKEFLRDKAKLYKASLIEKREKKQRVIKNKYLL